MAGLTWGVNIYVECKDCGDKTFNEGGGRFLVIETAYKFVPMEEDLDDLRTNFLMDLELKGWDVRELDVWDSDGEFYCPMCLKAEKLDELERAKI